MLDLARILARVTAVTEGRAPTVTAKTPPLQACTAVTDVTAENSKDAPQHVNEGTEKADERQTLSRTLISNRNNRNNRTASSGAGFTVTEAETETVTAVTEQARHRCWRVALSDGTRLVAVRPEGFTYAEMLETCREQFGAGRVAGIEVQG